MGGCDLSNLEFLDAHISEPMQRSLPVVLEGCFAFGEGRVLDVGGEGVVHPNAEVVAIGPDAESVPFAGA